MVPPSLRGPCRTRRPRARADAPIKSGRRSAGFCRSPHRPTTPLSRAGVIRLGRAPAPGGTPSCAPRSRGCTPRTSGSHGARKGLPRTPIRGLAPAAPRGGRRGAVHGGAPDARHGAAGRGAGQDAEEHPQRPCRTVPHRAAPCRTVPHRAAPCRTVPLGAREPPVQGTRAGPALGGRFHACRDRGRLRPRRARHRPRSDGGRGSLVDAFARRIVGGRVSRTAHCGVRARCPGAGHPPAPSGPGRRARRALGPRIAPCRHPARPGRLAEAGLEPCVGSIGDSSDTAPAETAIGLFKTEGDPPPWALARPRGGGVRHPRTEGPRAAANGSTGSTTDGSSSPSGASRPPRPRRATTSSRRTSRWRHRLQTKSPPGNLGRFTVMVPQRPI